ncbi:MAG: hypothetical protein ACTSUO_07795 [Candidatus Thorarchaeota archaeon]
MSEGSLMTKKLAMAAIFAALSIAITPIASIIPRMPWGVALFDPVSLFWLVAFMLGGGIVGMISMIAGAIGLLYFDPTGLGPLLKFVATFPLIFIPWLFVKSGITAKFRREESEEGGTLLANPKTYLVLMIIAFVVRLALMVPFNLFLAPLIIPGIYDDFSVEAIIIIVIIINSIQTIFDGLIPYIIVHGTKIFKQFRLW